MDQLDLGHVRPVVLDADGWALAALQSGSDGPAVLLVPGYTGTKEDFAPILDPVAAAGFRAVAIDLPGQFESPPLPAPADDYSPDRLAAVVLAACAELGPDTLLLGHSFGGLVCRAAVIADPTAVSSLVLLSSGPAELGGRRRTLVELLEPVLAQAGLAGLYDAMQSVAPEVGRTPELAAFLKRRFLAGSPEMLAGMGRALRSEPDRVAELAATGVPVLVVHGADDDAWPPPVQQDMALRLGATHATIPDAAHSAAIENPAALVPVLLDFWRSAS